MLLDMFTVVTDGVDSMGSERVRQLRCANAADIPKHMNMLTISLGSIPATCSDFRNSRHFPALNPLKKTRFPIISSEK